MFNRPPAHGKPDSPLFRKMIEELRPRPRSMPLTTQVWGSAGLLSGLPDASSAICVGHALFGLSPLDPGTGTHPPLRPLLQSLSAPVLQVADRAGLSKSCGYGQDVGSRSVSLGLGLANGLPRARHGDPQVIIGEQRRPVRAFTLENLIVKIDDAAIEPFDRALVIGAAGSETLSIQDWANWTGLSPLELMQSFSGRVPIRYVNHS